jgi:hypothetical protein
MEEIPSQNMPVQRLNLAILPKDFHSPFKGCYNHWQLSRDRTNKTAGYNWTDYETNTEIANELNITSVLEKIQDYRRSWIRNVNRTPRNILPKTINKTGNVCIA